MGGFGQDLRQETERSTAQYGPVAGETRPISTSTPTCESGCFSASASTMGPSAQAGESAGRQPQETEEEEEDGKPCPSPHLHGLERTRTGLSRDRPGWHTAAVLCPAPSSTAWWPPTSAQGWTEAVPLLAREQSTGGCEGLEAISGFFPVPGPRHRLRQRQRVHQRGRWSGLVRYCEENEIEFTRSRAYHKNDQAWIEQKNDSVIRRFVGHERHSGAVAGQTMAHLYGAVRLYVNYFQPSFQLLAKSRNGGSVTRRYSKPTTPCDRLLDRNDVERGDKADWLRKSRSELDPVSLLHSIRESQSALAAVGSVESGSTPDGESLESFLTPLPDLWRQGEVRPTHARRARAARGPGGPVADPFEGVWCEVLG